MISLFQTKKAGEATSTWLTGLRRIMRRVSTVFSRRRLKMTTSKTTRTRDDEGFDGDELYEQRLARRQLEKWGAGVLDGLREYASKLTYVPEKRKRGRK